MEQRKKQSPPSFVNGRKGQTSLVDSLVSELWKTGSGSNAWPVLSFAELREQVSAKQGYSVANSTIRSTIYKYPQFFERVRGDDGSLHWKLSDEVRRRGNI